MTTETTFTANETLCGLESQARDRYEAMFAKGNFEVVKTAAHIDLPNGERFMVTYDACGRYGFYYRERAFQMLSLIENRMVAVMALEQRLGEAVPS